MLPAFRDRADRLLPTGKCGAGAVARRRRETSRYPDTTSSQNPA
jgi:hypothetical protein